MHRQALVLHRYYELLADAILAHQQTGAPYLVLDLGAQAGRVLGEERVAVSTVRYWHSDYVTGNGLFRPDERGHFTRELLIMEEDIYRKFTKWSLTQAKKDDLSVEAAQDFLNNELLNTLEARCNAQPNACSITCFRSPRSCLLSYVLALCVCSFVVAS